MDNEIKLGTVAVRARFKCNELETREFGHGQKYNQIKVKLGAVCGKEGESKDYSDATPSGECWMQISDGRPAQKFFKPGKDYYLTFTEVPEGV